ncbi:uncharacterized protein LOC132755563 [Ruditapes philippinarum]|uniref:uncharacterized protein LOC132755563 n=1 Tax=Ruditapes philippinarum TaxID=129788 RepID=UPI00295AD23D|nr:uncharacterized protein LOC132755563 [Ruditapes philippinarum]
MLRNHFNCMHTGMLLYEEKEKKWLVWQKTTWVLKYFVISKGAKEDCVWSISCFKECDSIKQDWSISMQEVKSIHEYDIASENNFMGIRIIFNDHERLDIILKCDTEKNRKTWMSMLSQAYAESQPLSADSGFGSGGSVIGKNRNESDGKPTTESDGNLYSYAEHVFPAEEKDANLNTRETSGLYESFSQIPATNGVSGEYTRETDETNVKQVLSSPVQETKCSPNVSTRRSNIGQTEDVTLPKSYRLPVSRPLTRGTHSGQIHKIENNLSEETKECEEFLSVRGDDSLSAVERVDGCSDISDSVEQETCSFDSKSKYIGKTDRDGKSDCFITKENTLKSLEVQRNPAYDKDSRKHKFEPDQQKYSQSSILTEFDKDERKPPDDDDVNSSQPCMPDSHLAIYTGPTESDSSPRNLSEPDTDKQKSNDVERNNIYANVACSKDIEQDDFPFDGNERKNESDERTNCNIHNTPSANSFSSTESETPDEDAIYENTKFFQKQDHYCEGKESDKRNLKERPAGTFMTYDTGTDLKLCVSTDIGIKKFRIYQQGGNVSVFKDFSDRVHIFPNLDHFFNFYHLNNLPFHNFEVKLERGFNTK